MDSMLFRQLNFFSGTSYLPEQCLPVSAEITSVRMTSAGGVRQRFTPWNVFRCFLVLIVVLGNCLLTTRASAQFDYSPTTATTCVGQVVICAAIYSPPTNVENAQPIRYYFQWFVDGIAVTLQSQGYDYSNYTYNATAAGNHTVSVTAAASNPNGTGGYNPPPPGVPIGSPGSNFANTTPITVEDDNLTLTGVGANPNPATVGQSIAFMASATTNPDCSFTITYGWDFNDGTTGTGATPSHTYSNPGVYNVAVTATANYSGHPYSSVSQTFQLTVNPVITGNTPDYYIISDPANLNLFAGTSGSATIDIVPVHGFVGTVSLSLLGAPSGIWLYPSSVTIGPNNGDATLYVCIPSGSGNVTVQGTSGSLSHQDSVSITAH